MLMPRLRVASGHLQRRQAAWLFSILQGFGVLISAASSESAVGSMPYIIGLKPGGADGRGRRGPTCAEQSETRQKEWDGGIREVWSRWQCQSVRSGHSEMFTTETLPSLILFLNV